MKRSASAHLALEALAPARLVVSVAVAADAGGSGVAVPGLTAMERLSIGQAGASVAVREIFDQHGTRPHLADVQAGPVDVEYHVEVTGQAAPASVSEVDLIRYLRSAVTASPTGSGRPRRPSSRAWPGWTCWPG